MSTLTQQLAEANIRNGAIVSLIGGIGACRISNLPKGDPASDVVTDHPGPFELSGTGEVVDGVPHIHCVLGTDDGDRALAGHLHRAEVDHWFVNAYVLPL